MRCRGTTQDRDPLRVIVPFTDIHPATERALQAFAPHAERIQTTECDLTQPCPQPTVCPWKHLRHCHHESCALSYSKLMHRLWADGESFVIVEHDISIHESVIRELEECPEPWCSFGYPGPGWQDGDVGLLWDSLGCTRFSAELMATHTDLISAACQTDGMRAGDWRRLDVSILPALRARGYEGAHRHTPLVVSHHPYPYGPACGESGCDVFTDRQYGVNYL